MLRARGTTWGEEELDMETSGSNPGIVGAEDWMVETEVHRAATGVDLSVWLRGREVY